MDTPKTLKKNLSPTKKALISEQPENQKCQETKKIRAKKMMLAYEILSPCLALRPNCDPLTNI